MCAGAAPGDAGQDRNDFDVDLDGRPVLLVPSTMERASVGKRIVVAWNATRKSAQARRITISKSWRNKPLWRKRPAGLEKVK